MARNKIPPERQKYIELAPEGSPEREALTLLAQDPEGNLFKVLRSYNSMRTVDGRAPALGRDDLMRMALHWAGAYEGGPGPILETLVDTLRQMERMTKKAPQGLKAVDTILTLAVQNMPMPEKVRSDLLEALRKDRFAAMMAGGSGGDGTGGFYL